jgi:L1 cell adhesion molecule like protein
MYYFTAEDEAVAARIQTKNGLESYAYNLRNTLNDSNVAGKLDAADKTRLESAVDETIKWLDASQEASKEEYEDKQKELEATAKYVYFTPFLSARYLFDFFFSPIMQKLYSAGGAPPPGAEPSAAGEGPSVEEVD